MTQHMITILFTPEATLIITTVCYLLTTVCSALVMSFMTAVL